MKLEPLGDTAVVATLATRIDAAVLSSVLRLAGSIVSAGGRGILDVVPAYTTVTVFYDPVQFSGAGEDAYDVVCRFVAACAMRRAAGAPAPARKLVEIPVCYGGEYGPDIGDVAGHAGAEASDVVAWHAGARYLVHAIGFTPGFPFLGGLPDSICTPRRGTPRSRVPAGSVGIGGRQTGVYPIASPGGWNIIGRTPLALFSPERSPASLLMPGDRVRFRRITEKDFESWK